ncbi:MAG: hypothetical protein FWB97_09960 [Oscillospiraceae bacterium]|nr:hypothetical protein [Oscillospiraceae bacterium]
MNISSTGVNQATLVNRILAPQFQPAHGGAASINPVFRRDSLSIGNLAPQFQVYSARSAAARESWCISNHYPMPPDEVWPALSKVFASIDNADFSGKTNVEIYDWIENQFVEAFGKDFMMAHSIFGSRPITADGEVATPFSRIGSGFKSMLIRHLDGHAAVQEANRQRLFGDKDIIEIKDTIRASYPQRMTNREFSLMMAEMASIGAFGYDLVAPQMGNFIDATVRTSSTFTVGDINQYWRKMLDQTADVTLLFGVYNEFARGGRSSLGAEFRNFLINQLGATLGPDGLLIPDGLAGLEGIELDVEYQFDTPDLLAEFLETLNQHDARLRESHESADKSIVGKNELRSERNEEIA